MKFTNTKILNINAEDGLNIFRSNFEIDNMTFRNVKSDAFDSDFSNGTILGVKFDTIGNDGLDFSGSEVSIRNASFLK